MQQLTALRGKREGGPQGSNQNELESLAGCLRRS